MNERQIKRFERVFKGVANHWRIKILLAIETNPEITLKGIAGKLKSNYQTTAEHVRRLTAAGLIHKQYYGRAVGHSLTPYGSQILNVMKHFQE